jgi:hypothetical protein
VRRSTSIALVGLAAAGLGGCAGDPARAPLSYPDSGVSSCALSAQYRDVGLGISVDHHADGPITIEAVRAEGARDLEVVGAALVDVGSHYRTGFGPWPIEPDRRWGTPHAAFGRTVPAGEHVDLVVHLRRTAESGTADDLVIEYRAGGRQYAADVHQAVSIDPTCA